MRWVPRSNISSAASGRETTGHIPRDEDHEQQDHDGQVQSHSTEVERRNYLPEELHRRVGDGEDRLEHDDDQPGRLPISRESPDELDDDSTDEKEPKKKQYDVDHREHDHGYTLPDFAGLSKARWSQP